MAGIMVFPGAQPSRDRNGGAVIAELRFYENETTIPKAVYADEALTVQLPFPVVSDDAGRFVAIWAAEDDPYTVNWATADGQSVTLDDLTASQAADAMILDETEQAVSFIQALVAGYVGTVLYNFSSDTVAGDPGPGTMSFNSDTLSSVTEIYADNFDANGVDATNWLDSFGTVNTGANRGTLTIRSISDSTEFAIFYVSGDVINSTGYRTIPVTWADGTNLPADMSNISVNFVAAGAGLPGGDGWTPEFALVQDGVRFVQQVVDWFGGVGTKPTTGLYVGASGFVVNIADGVNVRGPGGAGTGDVIGPASSLTGAAATFSDASGKNLANSKVVLTPPATSATLTIANGKTLTASNTVTLAGTDGSTLNIGAGGALGPLATVASPTANNVILGNGSSAPTYVAPGTLGNVLTSNGTTWTSQPAAGSSAAPDVIIQYQTSSGVDSTTYAGGAWRVNFLTTVIRNAASLASLASNRITLPAGTYYVEWEVPFAATIDSAYVNTSRLYNDTGAATLGRGLNVIVCRNAGAGLVSSATSCGSAYFSVGVSSAVGIDVYSAGTNVANGYAASTGLAEVYGEISIWRVT